MLARLLAQPEIVAGRVPIEYLPNAELQMIAARPPFWLRIVLDTAIEQSHYSLRPPSSDSDVLFTGAVSNVELSAVVISLDRESLQDDDAPLQAITSPRAADRQWLSWETPLYLPAHTLWEIEVFYDSSALPVGEEPYLVLAGQRVNAELWERASKLKF